MQLLGDGYEIPEMTKLHGLLLPSRFAQRSASSVDRCFGLGAPVEPGRHKRLCLQGQRTNRHSGEPTLGHAGWPAWASAHVRLAGYRTHAACGLAHMCGTAVPAIVRLPCRFDA